jgi:predicted RNA methylase
VELNLNLVDESRRFLKMNRNGDRVEVIHADASEYVPPEPVDVVICEMLHVGLLNEKQLAVIDAFKKNYRQRFEGPLPAFIPQVTIQAVQPVEQNFVFDEYLAPFLQFQYPYGTHPRTKILGNPVIYHQLLYGYEYGLSCEWSGIVPITFEGTLNALRFITQSILATEQETQAIIDWHNQFLILPLEAKTPVCPGQKMKISVNYPAGAPLSALRPVVEGPL